MKKALIYLMTGILSLSVVSCDAIFDNLEGDLSKMTMENLLSTEAGLKGVLANLYTNIPMGAFSTGDRSTFFANSSRSTPSYGQGGMNSWWDYSQMRSINKFIEGLDSALEKGIITEAAYDAYMGEALFIRAYCYFGGVIAYGGMPIVETSLDDKYDGKENAGLYFPRSTEKETYDWIIAQLDEAAALLPEVQSGGDMRATKYAALALQARVALTAASISESWSKYPLDQSYVAVKRKLTYMEQSYAAAYYDKVIEAAGAIINSNAFTLYGGTTPASIDAAKQNLIDLFQNWQKSEGIFGRSYKSGSTTTGNGIQTWGPAQTVDGYLVGTGAVTANLADVYDYYTSATDRTRKDGTIVTRTSGGENYFLDNQYYEAEKTAALGDFSEYVRYNSVDEPFLLKDARFQAWVLYPGTFFHNRTINMQGGMIMPDGTVSIYPIENDGVVFPGDGETYYPYGGAVEDHSAFYRVEIDINTSNRYDYCFGQRKSIDEAGWNPYTQTPWYDLRYAEVLLSYAEAYAFSGKGDATIAKKALNDIRKRAGFTDEIEVTEANVMHEWKTEFAFENKWEQVLHRRRAHYNVDKNPQPTDIDYAYQGRKITLIPMVDLSGSEVKYIFPRAVSTKGDIIKFATNGQWTMRAENYYQSIPNHANNQIENNNTVNDIVKP